VAVGSPSFLFLIGQLGEMEGLPGLRSATYPGTLSIESVDEVRENLAAVTVDEIVRALTDG
jgi:hypothetical protein